MDKSKQQVKTFKYFAGSLFFYFLALYGTHYNFAKETFVLAKYLPIGFVLLLMFYYIKVYIFLLKSRFAGKLFTVIVISISLSWLYLIIFELPKKQEKEYAFYLFILGILVSSVYARLIYEEYKDTINEILIKKIGDSIEL